MATSNSMDDINLQNLKVEESKTIKVSDAQLASGKASTSNEDQVKQENLSATPQASAEGAASLRQEDLDFNQTPEEIKKALEQWQNKPSALNVPDPKEKM